MAVSVANGLETTVIIVGVLGGGVLGVVVVAFGSGLISRYVVQQPEKYLLMLAFGRRA